MADEPVEVAEQPHEEEAEAPRLDPEVEAGAPPPCPSSSASATPYSRAGPPRRPFRRRAPRPVARMAGLMDDALGIGLAAPQLGISQRLLVYRVGPDAL